MVRLMDFWPNRVLWINLWKLWIAEALLCWGTCEEALRATIGPPGSRWTCAAHAAERRRDFGSGRFDAGLTLTFAKRDEMNFPARLFRHFGPPFSTAEYRCGVSEQFACLPDVALLARLVR
jgi:hypothetical protein